MAASAASNAAVAGSVLTRLGEAYADLDPAGLKIVLAIKTVVGLALAAMLTVLFAQAIPNLSLPAPLAGIGWLAEAFRQAQTAEGLVETLPLVAGVMTLNAFLLHPTANYTAELRWFGLIALTSFAIVSAVGLLGPASWGYGVAPVAILWVPMITAGIYAQRWGQATAKFGIMTALLGVIFVVTNPTRELGFWFPAVALIALAVTFVVRFLTIRVSAVAAFHIQGFRFLEIAATDMERYRQGLPPPAQPDRDKTTPRPLRRRWARLQRYLAGAVSESPRLAPRLNAQIVSSYRMTIAGGMIAGAFAAIPEERRRALVSDPRMSAALAELVDRLTHPLVIAFPSERIVDPRLDEMLAELMKSASGMSAEQLQEVRFVMGLRRFERALNDYLEGRSQVDIAVVPVDVENVAAATKAAKSAAGRLALQALLATSVTTALQLLLNLSHAYWATLTVAMVLNGKAGQTTIRTLQRAGGTAIGVLVAIALVPFIGGNLPLEIVLTVLCVPLIMLTIEDGYLIASAAIGFLVVLGLHIIVGADQTQMLARVYETAIGAAVALTAAWVFLPTFAASSAGHQVATFLERCRAALVVIGEAQGPTTAATALSQDLQALAKEVPNIAAERRMLGRDVRSFEETVILLDALVTYIGQYEASRAPIAIAELPKEIHIRLKDLQDRLVAAMDGLITMERTGRPADRTAVAARPYEAISTSITDILPPGLNISPKNLLIVVEHAFAGNRIGATINDLAAVTHRILKTEGMAQAAAQPAGPIATATKSTSVSAGSDQRSASGL